MSDSDFLNEWPDFLGGDEMATLAYYLSPNAQRIIEHVKKEMSKSQKIDPDRSEWEWLQDSLTSAERELAREKLHAACTAFYCLGISARSLTEFPHEVKINMANLAVEALARRKPLQEKNRNSQVVRLIVQEIAKRNWVADTEQSIRVGEMCELVWAEMLDESIPTESRDMAMKHLPDKAAGLRNWISPVAPEYAKKRGRPRKKK